MIAVSATRDVIVWHTHNMPGWRCWFWKWNDGSFSAGAWHHVGGQGEDLGWPVPDTLWLNYAFLSIFLLCPIWTHSGECADFFSVSIQPKPAGEGQGDDAYVLYREGTDSLLLGNHNSSCGVRHWQENFVPYSNWRKIFTWKIWLQEGCPVLVRET